MRWIKASERLPEETAARIMWRFTNKCIGSISYKVGFGFRLEDERFTKDYKNIEWLDESTPTPERTAEEILDKYFLRVENADWYEPVLKAMEEYRLQGK